MRTILGSVALVLPALLGNPVRATPRPILVR